MRRVVFVAAGLLLLGQGCVLPWETQPEVINASEATISVSGAIRRTGKVPATCTFQRVGEQDRMILDTRFNGWQILSILPKQKVDDGTVAGADADVGFTVEEGTFRATETPIATYDVKTRTFRYEAPMALRETGEELRLTLRITCQDPNRPTRRR